MNLSVHDSVYIIYVCIFICTYTHMCIYAWLNLSERDFVCVCKCFEGLGGWVCELCGVRVCLCVCVRAYVCVFTYILLFILSPMHMNINICIHLRICIRMEISDPCLNWPRTA